jgi:cobalt-zinc-cadmium efflux system outer membrane protein
VEVVAAQHRVALADTLVAVAQEVLESVARRVGAGGVSPVEERRARVSLELARVERERTARALVTARSALGAAWGEPSPSFARASGDLEGVAERDVPSLERLLERVDASPELARWTTELGRREAERAAARANGTPDLTIGGGIRRFHGPDETAFTLGVSLPLPLFDRSRDAARAAQSRVEGVREERRDAATRLRRDLGALHAALVDAHDEAAALRDRILPEAEAALSESREAYQRGRLRLTDVLDAQRSAFELRGRYVDALAAANELTADVERLLGAPLFEEPTGGTR